MKGKRTIFILATYLLSLVGYFGLIFLGGREASGLASIFSNPLLAFLFILGALGPGLVAFFLTNKREEKNFKEVFNPFYLFFILVFVLVHIMTYVLFTKKILNADITSLVFAIIFSAITFGLQELGWIDLVYSYYLGKRSYMKAIIIVGLFKALAFFPLFFYKGFTLSPEIFGYVALMLVGLSGISIFLRNFTRSFIPSMIFIGLIYGLTIFMDLNTGLSALFIGLIEVIIAYGLRDLSLKTK